MHKWDGKTLLRDELHIHLYGCLSAEDLWNLGRDVWKQKKDRLAWYESEYEAAWGRRPDSQAYWTDTSRGFERLREDYVFNGRNSFDRFQASFNLAIALFGLEPQNTKVLDHVLGNQRKSGLRHVEYRAVIPGWFSDEDLADYFHTQCQSIARFNRESSGAQSAALAFSLPRQAGVFEDQYTRLREWIDQNREIGQMVTAIDFCFAEQGHPPSAKADFFARVKRDNQQDPDTALAILYHVGESFDNLSIESAARWVWEAHDLGADRLGHGIALGIDPQWQECREVVDESPAERAAHAAWLKRNASWLEAGGYSTEDRDRSGVEQTQEQTRLFQDLLIQDLAAKGAVIESCPTSNCRIGMIQETHHHPLKRFVGAGLSCLVSTDDPGIFAVILADEERFCREELGITDAEMEKIAEAGTLFRSERMAGRLFGLTPKKSRACHPKVEQVR